MSKRSAYITSTGAIIHDVSDLVPCPRCMGQGCFVHVGKRDTFTSMCPRCNGEALILVGDLHKGEKPAPETKLTLRRRRMRERGIR